MTNGFNTRELSQFQRDLVNLAAETMPNKSKAFLRKEGNKLRKETKAVAKSKVKKKTGELLKGIKRGKVYKYSGALSVRVYGGARHVHLINNGHRQVGPGGEETGFVAGKHFFEKAAQTFEAEFYNDTQDFIDRALEEGLC